MDENGEMIGIVSISEAMDRARRAGLDLVEVSPNAEPPVCKILDYGKYKYELQKKQNEARKKQKIIEVKEIQLRPMIDKHDLETKCKKIREFLDQGNKVKLTMRFRGREMAHQEIGQQVMNSVITQFTDVGKPESMPKMEGRQMVVILAPAKS